MWGSQALNLRNAFQLPPAQWLTLLLFERRGRLWEISVQPVSTGRLSVQWSSLVYFSSAGLSRRRSRSHCWHADTVTVKSNSVLVHLQLLRKVWLCNYTGRNATVSWATLLFLSNTSLIFCFNLSGNLGSLLSTLLNCNHHIVRHRLKARGCGFFCHNLPVEKCFLTGEFLMEGFSSHTFLSVLHRLKSHWLFFTPGKLTIIQVLSTIIKLLHIRTVDQNISVKPRVDPRVRI